MRTAAEVDQYRTGLEAVFVRDPDRAEYMVECFEACLPKAFWHVNSREVTHNRAVFKSVIRRYVAKFNRARKRGYSLLFMGDNGVGKTMFMCYILTQMMKRGFGVYYTTLSQLDVDIKRGFSEPGITARLDSLLDSDILAIDEIGKEHFKNDSYLNTRLELLAKKRFDDNDPVLMASKLEYESLQKMYCPSISSIWDGKYQAVQFEAGDFRKSISAKMRTDMGYE